MAKGKKTGGRQKGTPNKSTVKAIEDMAIMLDLNPDANPVEFLLAIMRCPDLQLLTRMKAAKDVLPYVLPSLQSIPHTGDKDDPDRHRRSIQHDRHSAQDRIRAVPGRSSED